MELISVILLGSLGGNEDEDCESSVELFIEEFFIPHLNSINIQHKNELEIFDEYSKSREENEEFVSFN